MHVVDTVRSTPDNLSEVHRERSLARPGRHSVQPHPRRRHHHRPSPGQGHDCDDPPQSHHSPGPDLVLGTTGDPAPTDRVALADRLAEPARQRQRASTDRGHPPTPGTTEETVEPPGSEARQSPTPTTPAGRCQHQTTSVSYPSRGSRLRSYMWSSKLARAAVDRSRVEAVPAWRALPASNLNDTH